MVNQLEEDIMKLAAQVAELKTISEDLYESTVIPYDELFVNKQKDFDVESWGEIAAKALKNYRDFNGIKSNKK